MSNRVGCPLGEYTNFVNQLRDTGELYYRNGWSVGTSSNYSVVVGREPFRLLVTASGKDKGCLSANDFVVVDEQGRHVGEGQPKSSAETLLHVVAAQQPGVGAVLHTHSTWATVLSDLFFEQGSLRIEGYEMLKGLAGISTHESSVAIEIFENTQDIASLATRVQERLMDDTNPLQYGFLIRRHGMYTWGEDLPEARRHVEILEFLFEVMARRITLASAMSNVTSSVSAP